MVIKYLLMATEEGLGNGETPIFPISIFKIKSGINFNEGDPNYDLFKYSMKVSAKRLFPNYSNLDVAFNSKFYKEGDIGTEVAYMGCVERNEIINYKIDEKQYIEGIGRAYDRVKEIYGCKTYGISEYVDTSNVNVKVYDSYSGKFVGCKKFIQNPDKHNWVRIKTSNGRSITATLDHPFPVVDRGRVFVKDIVVGDGLYVADDSQQSNTTKITSIEKIEVEDFSFDLETETDRFDVSGLRSHNCRTRVMANAYDSENEVVTGRGNLSFTSINLPRLGIKANKDLKKFFESLDQMMLLVKNQLLARFEIQCLKHPRNYPFLMGQGIWTGSDKLGPDDDIRDILKNGTFSIGFIGLAECLTALTGKHHGESTESQELGLKIIGHMRELADKWSQEEKLNYTILATPAEGLSDRFLKIDRQRFGIIDGVTDKGYYSNSFHIPVTFHISAFKKINLEAPYHAMTNAGHITYIELDGDPTKNLDAFEKVVRYMHDAGIGYGAINHPVDRDAICGYSGIIDDVCPRCGRKEGEPMTEEMWQKIKGYASAGNASTCGTCGNPREEADRVINPLTISGDM